MGFEPPSPRGSIIVTITHRGKGEWEMDGVTEGRGEVMVEGETDKGKKTIFKDITLNYYISCHLIYCSELLG